MSRRRVGLGCSGRCAPACALPLRAAFPSPFALCPWLGGVEGFDGVFGGRFNRSRSAAFSAIRASTRTSRVWISASFSGDESEEISGDGVMGRLNRNSIPGATKIYRWGYCGAFRPKS
jgi:hypothetical protein